MFISPTDTRWLEGNISELDIYPAAKLLVDQFGEDAALRAGQRADALLARSAGPYNRAADRIARAILRDAEPSAVAAALTALGL